MKCINSISEDKGKLELQLFLSKCLLLYAGCHHETGIFPSFKFLLTHPNPVIAHASRTFNLTRDTNKAKDVLITYERQ